MYESSRGAATNNSKKLYNAQVVFYSNVVKVSCNKVAANNNNIEL